jgi:hypothetical protein
VRIGVLADRMRASELAGTACNALHNVTERARAHFARLGL